MHKTLPTLGNEKEQYQIKFYEKSSSELIFLAGDQKSQNVLFHSCDWAGDPKGRLHH